MVRCAVFFQFWRRGRSAWAGQERAPVFPGRTPLVLPEKAAEIVGVGKSRLVGDDAHGQIGIAEALPAALQSARGDVIGDGQSHDPMEHPGQMVGCAPQRHGYFSDGKQFADQPPRRRAAVGNAPP